MALAATVGIVLGIGFALSEDTAPAWPLIALGILLPVVFVVGLLRMRLLDVHHLPRFTYLYAFDALGASWTQEGEEHRVQWTAFDHIDLTDTHLVLVKTPFYGNIVRRTAFANAGEVQQVIQWARAARVNRS